MLRTGLKTIRDTNRPDSAVYDIQTHHQPQILASNCFADKSANEKVNCTPIPSSRKHLQSSINTYTRAPMNKNTIKPYSNEVCVKSLRHFWEQFASTPTSHIKGKILEHACDMIGT
jgi:hypothetical protein